MKAWEKSDWVGASDKRFMLKLKSVKKDIKTWRADLRYKEMEEYNILLRNID